MGQAMNDDYNEPADGPITLERVSHHLDCLAVDCEWRADEVWKYIRSIQCELANRTRVDEMRAAVKRLETAAKAMEEKR